MNTDKEWHHLIDGELVASERSFPVVNPATAESFAHCPLATTDDLDRAVLAAQRAFPGWAATPIDTRREMIHRFANLMHDQAETLCLLLTLEQGKPKSQARAEFLRAAQQVKDLSSIELRDHVLKDDGETQVTVRYRPLGVIGGIAPWNAPIALSMHKLAQALYTGNCLVLKPSPYTPLSSLAVAELAARCFPAGVVNVLAGGDDLGKHMTRHPAIAKISFTGSGEAGKQVLASAAGTLKRVTLELGGNDPAIVLADADLDEAAAGIARSAFANCGQICMAVKRVYAAEEIHEELARRVAEIVRGFKVGPGDRDDSDLGPLQNHEQFRKVTLLIEATKATEGALFLTGGEKHAGPGYFVTPAVVTGLPESAPLVKEEQFGPVLPIQSFTSDEDAIAKANDTRFGLGASVWSRDIARATAMAERLEAGSVWVNRHGGSPSDVPFGGAKESGIGREHGEVGLHAYMEMQVLTRPMQA